MIAQPNSSALFGGGPWLVPGGYAFENPDDFLMFVFGPDDHDAHVKAWREHRKELYYQNWLADRKQIEKSPNFIGTRYAS